MTAETGDTPAHLTPLFPEDDVPRILTAILQASVGLQKKSATEFEDRVTDRLWKHMRRIEPFRDGPLHISLQAAVLDSDSDRESPEGRADLEVTCGRGPDVYFAIEAKRLRVIRFYERLDTGAREYVVNGMMRFVTGQYAPRMNVGAMLGYVFDGNVTAARDDISRAIEQWCDILKLRQGVGLRRSTILPNRAVDETAHAPDKRELILYHVFVSV
jgi:hypothetical protein